MQEENKLDNTQVQEVRSDPPNQETPKEKRDKKTYWMIIALIVVLAAVGFVWMSRTANGVGIDTDDKNITIIPGQAYVDFSVLNCDRFLAENNFTYLNRSQIDSAAQVVDHVLCILKDYNEKYPEQAKEAFRKYNIVLVP